MCAPYSSEADHGIVFVGTRTEGTAMKPHIVGREK